MAEVTSNDTSALSTLSKFAIEPTKDFFGRVIKETAEEIQKKKERKADDIVKSEIWFHHKEGYNNAVRKTVLIRDLL